MSLGKVERRIPDALLESLQGALTLRTWPEYAEVPATAVINVADTDAGRAFPGVVLNPSAPLEDRWYVVRLGSVPSGATLPLPASYRVLPDGALGARFRTGSDPVLWGIRVCSADGASHKVRLEFSERITTGVDVGTIVSVSQAERAVTCAVTSSPAWPNGEWEVVALACSGVDDNVAITVSLGDGLQSVTGHPVTPFSYRFTPHDLPAIESACGVYRP